MPIYEYEHVDDEEVKCPLGKRFEQVQSMRDDPLEECPACGKPCRRLFSAFSVSGGSRSLLSKDNLEKHGFTQYKKIGHGEYQKTAGRGPGHIVKG